MFERPKSGRGPLRSTRPPAGGAKLVPCLLLRQGEVCLPAPDGPVPAVTPDGGRYDPFEVMDRLASEFSLVYLVDLDGVERAEPQLDFLQELSRDAALWVDGGVRNADQAIDILVAGAQRAVLSSAALEGPRELRRSWKLSTELVFEIELDERGLVAPGDWGTRDPLELATAVRGVGVDHLVVSPREVDPDWTLIQAIAAGGPTWVNGSFEATDLPHVAEAGARGGIFHLDRLLGSPPEGSETARALSASTARDDET